MAYMMACNISTTMGLLGFLLLVTSNLAAASLSHQYRPAFPYNTMVSEESMAFTEVQSENVSQECMNAFGELMKNQTMLFIVGDAIGKPAAGAFAGFNAWFGHYEECTGQMFTMNQYKYCTVQMKVNPGGLIPPLPAPISWGVCAPKKCSPEDVKNAIILLAKFANISQYINITPVPNAAALCSEEQTYDTGFIGTVAFCSFILFLIVVCALIEAARKFNFSMLTSPILRIQADNVLDSRRRRIDKEEDDVPLIGSEGNLGSESVQIQEPSQPSILTRLVQCFSLASNIAKLVDSKQSDRSISCLNGLRVISMFWVVLGHIFVFVAMIPIENPLSFLNFLPRFGFQAIANATFSVDTFFFLSGFLVGYLTFLRMQKTDGKIPWFWFYFHRYWRLTPVYAFTILFFMYLVPYFGQGPLWLYMDTKTACSKYWWTDLLYINNFWPKEMGQQCIGWVWYLANDMQFFIISPIFLILLYNIPIVGVIVVMVGILASFVTTASLVGYYNVSPFMILDQNNLPGQDTPLTFTNLVYQKPYCRICVYLVGLLMGYVIYRIGNRKINMNPIVAFVGWLLTAVIAMSVLYGTYPSAKGGYVPDKATNIIYTVLSRFAWSIVLSWIVFACKYGYGGWINSILSWSGWIIWSRLTYTTYLLHPIVLMVFYFNFATAVHFSIVLFSVFYVGALGIAYGLAAVFSLAIEYPFANIEKLFMPKDVQSKRRVDAQNRRKMEPSTPPRETPPLLR